MAAVDEVDEEELRSLYHDPDLSVRDVCERIGFSSPTLYKLLDEFEIDHRSPDGLKPDDGSPVQYPELHDEEWLREEYCERGKSTREIANQLGCGSSTVSSALQETDIDIDKPGGAPEYPEIHDPDWLREKIYVERQELEEIASQVGCSEETVSKMAGEFGIRTQGKWPVEMRFPKNVTRTDVISAYRSTGSLEKAGEQFDVGAATVALWLDKLGVERQRGSPTGSEHPNWNPDHTEYYGENWWSQRRRALSEADHKCRVCGMSDERHQDEYGFGLDVHHVTPIGDYESAEAANELENLAVLCRPCHAKYEGLPVLPVSD